MLPQLENLARIAAVLRKIPERFVFAGASILPLFLDKDFGGIVRRTDDTDVVVPVLHYGEWSRLRDALISHGFRERADDRAARQILFWFDGLAVDFIPARMREFGTENRWLSLGFDSAEPDETPDGEAIERLPVTAWLASKIAAFEQRGRVDVMMSRDLDDIVTLLIGRSRLPDDVRNAPMEIRTYIEGVFRAWRLDPMVWDAMDGYAVSSESRKHLDKVRDGLASPSR
jgi:hypothetical protein